MKLIIIASTAATALALSIAAGSAAIEATSSNEYYHLGEYYIHTGRQDLAISNYKELIARYPSGEHAERGWLQLGRSYYVLMREAMAGLDKAKARGDKSEEEVAKLKSDVTSYRNLAVSAYRKTISQFPGSRAKGAIGIALTYAASGPDKEDEALREFAKVIAEYPEQAGRAQILLGDTYASLGDTAAAKEAYRAAYIGFPEAAALAMIKSAGLSLASEGFAAAADGYDGVIASLGIDGAYNPDYRPVGDIMKTAIEGRGEAERRLKKDEDELDGYAAVAARYSGTRVAMVARVNGAKALWHYGRQGESEAALRAIAAEYPLSVWAMKSLLELAALQGGNPEAAETCGEIIRGRSSSIFWVKAQVALAEAYIRMADAEDDADEKKSLRAKARKACDAVVRRFPACPESDKVRDFISTNKL